MIQQYALYIVVIKSDLGKKWDSYIILIIFFYNCTKYLHSIECPIFFLSDSLSILYSIADCFCAITFKSWTSLCWSKLTPGKVLMLCNAFWASRAAFRVKNVTKQQPKERNKKELYVVLFLYILSEQRKNNFTVKSNRTYFFKFINILN